jgi:branched-chain amino acid transport system ATP-binding protein
VTPLPEPPPGVLLHVEGVTVRFGGLLANNNVQLWCREGAITALLGPNGAGKTTCFNVITGAQQAECGRVRFAGQDVTGLPAHTRARLGMGRTFQNLAVVDELSVLENAIIGASRFRRYGAVVAALGLPMVGRSDRRQAEIAALALRVVGLGGLADVPAGSLPYGLRRRLEIARALALAPRLLLLDEPAAGMDSTETAELADALRAARDQWGITILVVEHDLDLVRRAAEDAFVLDFGVTLAGGRLEDVLKDPAVIEAYLGPERVA